MGVINYQSCTGEVLLRFCFMRTTTNSPVVLPAFYMSFLDIDATEDSLDWTGERLTIGGFSSMTVPDPHTYDIGSTTDGLTVVTSGEVSAGQTNNPSDPTNLTPEQTRVSVMFGFEEKSCFELSVESFSKPPCNGPISGGRSFYFFGASSLDDQCVLGCLPSNVEEVQINFADAVLAADNLGGLGENVNDPKELRYQGIGNFNGQSLDLVVTTLGNYASTKPKKNGFEGNMGVINVQSCTGAVKLKFCFMRSTTNTPVELPAFQFTFLDIDATSDSIDWTGERLTIGGFSSMTAPDTHTYEWHSIHQGFITVTAGEVSAGQTNNPTDPTKLTPEQTRVSVMFGFEKKSCFELSVESFSKPACDGPLPGGRSFYFFGASSLQNQCT